MRRYLLSALITFFVFSTGILASEPEVEILNDDIDLAVGDSVMMQAVYKDTNDIPIDTTFSWSVIPDSLGYFNSTNYFVGGKPGNGYIYATLDTLVDSVKVHVHMHKDSGDTSMGRLLVWPADTTIMVGDTLQFKAMYIDTSGVVTDTTVHWEINGKSVGPFFGDGTLVALLPGMSVIKGRLMDLTGTAKVTVIDTAADTTGINTIRIARVKPDGRILPDKDLKEGEVFVMGGIPAPFNILDGGYLYFPVGSLKEDITLHIKLPSFAKFKNDSVHFPHEIINGIQFDVLVNDTLVEPYYFERPLSVALPFKRGHLKRYGITAEELSLFFAMDSVTFDTIGIENVVVDTSANRIFGQVAHFSTLVLKKNPNAPTSQDNYEEPTNYPDRFTLYQNYPNPFNPSTTIRFNLPEATHIRLTIYNILGEEVAMLVNGFRNAGTYTVSFVAADFKMSTGVYFYRLEAGTFVHSRKMILIK